MVVGDMYRICLTIQECTFQFAEPGERTVAGWRFAELPFTHLTRETGVWNVSACSPELAVAHSHPFFCCPLRYTVPCFFDGFSVHTLFLLCLIYCPLD